MSVGKLIARLERNEAELPTAQRINHAAARLRALGDGPGLLAALIGVTALLATHWAGRRAQQSRETLLQVFSIGSRSLPYVLVSHVVAMAATVALALSYEGLAMWHVGRLGSGEVKLMAVLGVIAAFCVYSIWQLLKQLRHMLGMFTPEPLEMFGQVVTPEQAPGLWRNVNEVAGKLRRAATGPYCGEPGSGLLRDVQRGHCATGEHFAAGADLACAAVVSGPVESRGSRRGDRP